MGGIRLSTKTLFLAVVCLVTLANFFWAERTPAGGGLGWDGMVYGDLARDPYGEIFVEGEPAYFIQRALPSVVVYAILKLLGASATDPHLIRAFEVLDVLLLAAMGIVWIWVGDTLGFAGRARWLSFIGFFLTYGVLKQFEYVPVNTDVPGLFLALLVFYFFLRDNREGLLIAGLAAAFTWPPVFYSALLLFVWPKQGPAGRVSRSIAAFPATLLTGAAVWWIHVSSTQFEPLSPVLKPTLPLAIACTTVWIWVGSRELFRSAAWYDWRAHLRLAKSPRLYTALALAAGVHLLLHRIGAPGGPYPIEVVESMALESTRLPLLPIVSHVVFYGPLAILTVLAWQRIARLAPAFGPGLLVVLLLHFVQLTLDSESRRALAVLPILVSLTVVAVEERRWPASRYWLLGVLALVYSKVWLHINSAGPNYDSGSELAWPQQLFFMSAGPWMSNTMYVVQGAIVLATGVALFYLWRRSPGPPRPSDP